MSFLPWTCRACRSKAPLRTLSSAQPATQLRKLCSNSKFFRVSDEVRQAIHEKRPVVALETTIYTHGFPYPDNVTLSTNLESLVRANGGIPATIGILEGVARVGLSGEELARLVSNPGSPDLLKISRRDLAFALGLKNSTGKPFNGGTTISGTTVLAHMAGIKIFGTGGLGGVHRGAEQTMDISADLTELGRTPVTVISSGCKSFLDIPKTLEFLETQGVAVATFADGRSGPVDFPAFYSRDSGVKSPKTLVDEQDAARVILAQHALGLQSGLVFSNPIPEQHGVSFELMETAIAQAIEQANAAGASGAANTPYILDKIKEITGNKSIEANVALVEGNVVRATKVAVALQKLEQDMSAQGELQGESVMTGPAASSFTREGVPHSLASHRAHVPKGGFASQSTQTVARVTDTAQADIFVAGSLAVDLACDYAPRSDSASQTPEMQTSNPATIKQSLGGVGHNIARAAHLMGAKVHFCSAVGDDLAGKAVQEALVASDMSTAGIKSVSGSQGGRTAQYVAINNCDKDLVLAMADMSILETPSSVNPIIAEAFDDVWLPQLLEQKPAHLVVDGNWPSEYLARWLDAGKQIDAYITFEPVSASKSARLFDLPKPNDTQKNVHTLATFPNHSVHLSTPNIYELSAMYQAARLSDAFDREDWWRVIDALGIPHTGARVQMALATSSELVDQGIPQQSIQLLPFIPCICTKLGAQGVLVTQILSTGDPRLTDGASAPYILSRSAQESGPVGGVYMRLFPAVEKIDGHDVVSVNGVGDTFAGTLIAGLSKVGKGARVEDLIDVAQRAAVLTLKSELSVAPALGTLSKLW